MDDGIVEEHLDKIMWNGEFNLYSWVLKKLEGEISVELFGKIKGIYDDLYEMYLKNRNNLDKTELDKQLGNLHDNFEEVTLIDPDDKYGFAFQDDECERITELVEERLSQSDLSALSNIAFENWRKHCKLGDPKEIYFDDDGKRRGEVYVPHISHANDFFGKEIYNRFKEKIQAGDEIRVLDLGAGTGGTTEAIVNWVYTLAKNDEKIDESKLKLNIIGVEFNQNLASDFEIKANKLREKYKGVQIEVMGGDMAQYVSQIAQGDRRFDAVAASYSIHHLKRETRQELMDNAYESLVDGGVFLRADPNGGKSEINRKYFNFTDEGTFASFDTGDVSAEDLTGAGFEGIDVLKDALYKNRLNQLLGSDVVDSLVADYRENKGYISVGIKGNRVVE
ncbi:MAG: hypothetical protein DRN71_01795 [Candidatus Nanohalarchaeota archaeon]|nr:MAG: hypothetical protein DRN71_01795 [Candidatus Nanohaloarchaeota archaeon]